MSAADKTITELAQFFHNNLRMEETKSYDLITPLLDYDANADAVETFVTNSPPAHYTLQINSFQFLLDIIQKLESKRYNSETFDASGYKWQLSLYPNADADRNGEGHISLYLSIQETSALRRGWELNVGYKFFVFDHIRDQYLIVRDAQGRSTRLHEMKKECGIARLLDLEVFKDPTKGYLFHDKCVFGVEILAIGHMGRGEYLSLPQKICSSYTWKIPHFSKCAKVIYSNAFTLGGYNWTLTLHPEGDYRQQGKSLSLFLSLTEPKPAARVYVDFKLSIKDQKNGKDFEREASSLFSPTVLASWGFPSFLSLDVLKDASRGYLEKNTLVIQVEITRISSVKRFS